VVIEIRAESGHAGVIHTGDRFERFKTLAQRVFTAQPVDCSEVSSGLAVINIRDRNQAYVEALLCLFEQLHPRGFFRWKLARLAWLRSTSKYAVATRMMSSCSAWARVSEATSSPSEWTCRNTSLEVHQVLAEAQTVTLEL